jgi:hypothetical protein
MRRYSNLPLVGRSDATGSGVGVGACVSRGETVAH